MADLLSVLNAFMGSSSPGCIYGTIICTVCKLKVFNKEK